MLLQIQGAIGWIISQGTKHISSSSRHLWVADHAGVGFTGRLWLSAVKGEVTQKSHKKVLEIQAKVF